MLLASPEHEHSMCTCYENQIDMLYQIFFSGLRNEEGFFGYKREKVGSPKENYYC